MSLAKCLVDFPVGEEDLAAIRKLMGKSKDEAGAVETFARSLEKDLDGLRKQLADKGHDVEPSLPMAAAPANAPSRPDLGIAQGSTPTPAAGRLMEIGNKLVDELNGIVRQGRLGLPKSKAAGVYKRQSGVIRLAKPDDFDTLSHELGHHLEVAIGPRVQTLMQAHAAELKPMAYQGAKKGTELKEGYAEFTRLMLTNPLYAEGQAPNFNREFRALLAEPEYAALATAIEDARAGYRAWLDQPSTEAVASTIVSSKETGAVAKVRKDMDRYGLGHTIFDRLSRAYAALVDDLTSWSQATRALASVIRDKNGKPFDLIANDDPGKLIRLSRQSYNAGLVDITDGIRPYRSKAPASPSLRDAIILAMAKPNVLSRWDDEMATRFGGYLWSRRALGEWDRFDKGLIPNQPDKLTKGDHELNVKEMEAAHPQFAQAAKMVHEWATELWKKKYESGLITEDQWKEGLQITDYVPGQRVFDQDYDPLGVSDRPKGTLRGGFVRRFRGSRRDIINPLESLMKDAFETNMAIARNDAIKALDRLAKSAGPGGGTIAEAIPVREIKATIIDPLEAVENAARASGMSVQDSLALRDSVETMVGDTKAAIFRPAIINEKGEPIIFWRDGGEVKALRLADGDLGRNMVQSFTNLSHEQQNIWVNMLAKPAAVLRMGITSDPAFLIANFIRDQTMAALMYGKPLKRLAYTARGVIDDLFVTAAAREYNQAGGIMGGATVAGLGDMRIKRDLAELRHRSWAGSRLTSLKGLLSITELSETATRMANYRIFKEEAMKRGLPEIVAMQEAAHRANDVLDFSRKGSMMQWTRMVPFMSASIQGLDKGARHAILPFFRDAVTKEDEVAKALAAKTWARVAALSALGMGLHAYNSQDEEYRDMDPRTKASHWMFKTNGEWWRVPKPFEYAVPLNLAEAAYTAMALQDPRWKDQFLDGVVQMTLPPNVMEGNPTIRTAFGLASGNDIHSGLPIVPPEVEGLEPWLRYTERSSAASKQLGELLNEPPVVIDYIFQNHTGSLGRSALSLYDWAASDKPMPGWDDWPVLARFMKDASRGASSSRAFWDLVSEKNGRLEGARRSWQEMLDAGNPASAADYLASLDNRAKVWIAAGSIDAEARRIHPFVRAKNAVLAVRDLRRDIMDNTVTTSTGSFEVSRKDRGTADDILGSLAMAEARNALVMMGEPGWSDRKLIDVTTFHRELEAVSPDLAEALADRFASAKVLPMSFIQEAWPDLQDRLKSDGSIAFVADLGAIAEAEGFEMGGFSIPKRERGEVPGLAEMNP